MNLIGKEYPRLNEIAHGYLGDDAACHTYAVFGGSRFSGMYNLSLDAETCRKFAAYLLTVADKLEDSHDAAKRAGLDAEHARPIARPPEHRPA